MTGAAPVVLISPDSLKGSLSAARAANILAEALRDRGCRAMCVPLSDGGEGLTEICAAALGGCWAQTTVEDPLGRPTIARYLLLPGGRAVVESAEAIGLTKLRSGELAPFVASSRGLGQLLTAVFGEPRVSRVLLGLGGVATVDGGRGLRETLPSLTKPVDLITDVANPLLGDRGAAAVYGPQKGASAADVRGLERRLAAMDFPAEVASAPGAGAAGGLGAMLSSMGATSSSGTGFVMNVTGWHDHLAAADLVITGEGSVDASTLDGKVVARVVETAAAADVPTVVFGGLVCPVTAQRIRERGAAAVLPLNGSPDTASADVAALGRSLGTLMTLRRAVAA